MGNSQNPTARKDGLVVQEMPDEVLVYDLNTNKAHCLNQTAAFVWKSCNGRNSVAEIKNLVEKNFGSPVTEDFIWLAIDQLNKDDLLQEKVNSKFAGVSRRDVIKKIGLASIVALPVVASLTVPTAAYAVGTCTGGCDTGNPCATGNCTCRSTCPPGSTNPGAPCTVGSNCGGTPQQTCPASGTCVTT
jgi:hypothetical protein